jgi:hypothetical protein
MSVTITCTQKNGTTIKAQATSQMAVTWTLYVDGSDNGIPGADQVSPGGKHSVTFANVPTGSSYTVTASTGAERNDSQDVPFGTCT